jgi:hypothetical protein
VAQAHPDEPRVFPPRETFHKQRKAAVLISNAPDVTIVGTAAGKHALSKCRLPTILKELGLFALL